VALTTSRRIRGVLADVDLSLLGKEIATKRTGIHRRVNLLAILSA
jgi:hypothetical protein